MKFLLMLHIIINNILIVQVNLLLSIRAEIEQETQLNCHIGIGPNMLLSKLALDNESYQHDRINWSIKL
ncbi:hypothetical protein ACM3BO_08930 [Mammaliicoccus sciuri]